MSSNNRLRYLVMYFSLQEREKREYAQYRKVRCKLESLSDDELNSRYINFVAKYNYKKHLFFVILVALLLVGLAIWELFYSFFDQMLQIYSLHEASTEEIAEFGLIFSSGFLVFLCLIVLFYMIVYLKDLRSMYKQLLFIEAEQIERGAK